MSFEENASSWAVSLFDALESNGHTRIRIYAASGGALATIIMWAVHLTHPEIYAFFLQVDSWAKLFLGIVLAPPFVVGFTVGSFIYRQPVEAGITNEVGPMSTYFYQERASRRWRLLIAAGILAAVNFILMLVTSGV